MGYAEAQYVINTLGEAIDAKLGLDGRVQTLESSIPNLIISSATQPVEQPVGGLWLICDSEGNCKNYKIKTSSDSYSELYNVSTLSSLVSLPDGRNLDDYFSNNGNVIYECSSAALDSTKIVIKNDFSPVVGAKILVVFNYTNVSTSAIKLQVKKEDGSIIGTYPIYGSSLSAINPGSVVRGIIYELFFDGTKFITMGGLTVAATNTCLGSVLSGGDISVASNGAVTVNNSDKATSDSDGNIIKETYAVNNHASSQATYGTGTNSQYGHLMISGETSEDGILDPSATAASHHLACLNYTSIVDLTKKIKNVNYIANSDFLVKTVSNGTSVINVGGWGLNNVDTNSGNVSADENGISLTTESSFLTRSEIESEISNGEDDVDENPISSAFSISQIIANGESLSNKEMYLSFKANGKGTILLLLNESKLLEEEINLSVLTEKVIKINSSEISDSDSLKIIIAPNDNITISYIQLESDFSSNHFVEEYSLEYDKCQMYDLGGKFDDTLNSKSNNLLVNSDFSFNRQEESEYICTSTDEKDDIKVSVDGWEISGNGTLTVRDSGVVLTPSGNGMEISQYVTYPKFLSGKTLTASVYLEKEIESSGHALNISIKCYGSEDVVLFVKDSDFPISEGLNFVSALIPAETEQIQVIVSTSASTLSPDYNLKYIKCEVGGNYTGYSFGSYVDEYNKVSRYEVGSNTKEITGGSSSGGKGKNILINSDFCVNQRNKISYECYMPSQSYGIDRWEMGVGIKEIYSGYENVSEIERLDNETDEDYMDKLFAKFNFDGVEIHSLSEYSNNSIRQYVNRPSVYGGQTLTFSANIASTDSDSSFIRIGYILEGEEFYSEKTSLLPDKENSVYYASLTIPNELDYLFVEIGFDENDLSTNQCVKVKWTKFEVGTVPTEYEHPSYESELIKCKAFYQELYTKDLHYELSSTVGLLKSFTFSIPMRIKPSITIKSLKYDNTYVTTASTLNMYPFTDVPSNNYKIYECTKTNFSLFYRSRPIGISYPSSGSAYLDNGNGTGISCGTVSANDGLEESTSTNELSLSLQSSSTALSLNSASLYPKKMVVSFICDAEIHCLDQIDLETTNYILTSNTSHDNIELSSSGTLSSSFAEYHSMDGTFNIPFRPASTVGTHYLQLEFKNNIPNVYGINLTYRNYSGGLTNNAIVNNYQSMSYSDDGDNWIECIDKKNLFPITVVPSTVEIMKTYPTRIYYFDKVHKHKYWRINTYNSSTSCYSSIFDWQFIIEAGSDGGIE